MPTETIERRAALHRLIWRWHFYAGLFCIPFVIALAITGSIYLFRPQIEARLDAPYRGLAREATVPPSAQVAAALSALPGAKLKAYQLPLAAGDAAEILVDRDATVSRVYVHPETAKVLRVVEEEQRPMRVLAHFHGELLLGDRGSMLVELAASWAIVLMVTGLYLWWPRGRSGFAGVLYPRLRGEERIFWRDLHGVTAFWVSGLALFLLVSGLPWAKSWGSLLREIRQQTSGVTVRTDWPIGAGESVAHEHAGHVHGESSATSTVFDPAALDRVVAAAHTLGLEPPVLIAPPAQRSTHWTAKSDASNRPRRADAELDADGRIASRKPFSERPLVDRMIGYGVAAHEGQLFGALNQALGVFTALGLIVVCVSAVRLWWKRRPSGELGARARIGASRVPVALFVLIVALAIALPLLGFTLIAVVLVERLALRRIEPAARFLGLHELRVAER
ncbi:MAG: PepSY domain-containing protein [Rhodanobacteraceae bacterium]